MTWSNTLKTSIIKYKAEFLETLKTELLLAKYNLAYEEENIIKNLTTELLKCFSILGKTEEA